MELEVVHKAKVTTNTNKYYYISGTPLHLHMRIANPDHSFKNPVLKNFQ